MNFNLVLKVLASELGPVFAHLFQQYIDMEEIPKEWSLANICPLFKKGDRSFACNYRPVSLTCIPGKLLEHIVCSNIMSHLTNINLCQIDNMHSERGTAVKFSWSLLSTNGLKSWITADKLIHLFWTSRKLFYLFTLHIRALVVVPCGGPKTSPGTFI